MIKTMNKHLLTWIVRLTILLPLLTIKWWSDTAENWYDTIEIWLEDMQ